ncbi:MICOS complex subunit mic19 [Tolypocladium capitatum]|uniref:MICOS complex subunit mic19 n=1 Tax=Tolypocladium capitatum TaxID=45235 RepID=A0A2K3QNG2_9HYPO|nr:MICOS complex subunit mic19 [Tolypocladium capitatum]
MGANTSKQDARGGYQWKASGPPSVSLDVLESLQTSPETDASRAKLIEQHIQARVAEELKKLQQRESEALKLAYDETAPAEVGGGGDGKNAASGPTRFTVGKEVEELRRKLEERKQVRALPDGVENARSEVIRCLRENNRRPLDCWQEVENFKAEVKKLEKGWVDKVTS